MEPLFGESGDVVFDVGVQLLLAVLHFFLKGEVAVFSLLILSQFLLPQFLKGLLLA